jgi:hypothetical protein
MNAEAIAKAREVFRGDWDAQGTSSAHLPLFVAEEWLRARGWVGGGGGLWVAPGGDAVSGRGRCDIYQALALQIRAEAYA